MKRLLPGLKGQAATAVLIAIMLFVMSVTAAAGLALWNGQRLVGAASQGDIIVQLPGGADDAAALEDFVADFPQVAAASKLGDHEIVTAAAPVCVR